MAMVRKRRIELGISTESLTRRIQSESPNIPAYSSSVAIRGFVL